MTTLDILKTARATLKDEVFVFSDWGVCTCGHIYAADRGVKPQEGRFIRTMYEFSSPLFTEVATALGWTPEIAWKPGGYVDVEITPAEYISNMTSDLVDSLKDMDRTHAIKVVDEAIAVLEAKYEQDCLNVLAQTKEIVDNAEVEDGTARGLALQV